MEELRIEAGKMEDLKHWHREQIPRRWSDKRESRTTEIATEDCNKRDIERVG